MHKSRQFPIALNTLNIHSFKSNMPWMRLPLWNVIKNLFYWMFQRRFISALGNLWSSKENVTSKEFWIESYIKSNELTLVNRLSFSAINDVTCHCQFTYQLRTTTKKIGSFNWICHFGTKDVNRIDSVNLSSVQLEEQISPLSSSSSLANKLWSKCRFGSANGGKNVCLICWFNYLKSDFRHLFLVFFFASKNLMRSFEHLWLLLCFNRYQSI